jgi:pimeloyl-ACP methyl ester carboxylesterase
MAAGELVCRVDGLRIAYERAGEGPLLVLLHGYVGDGGVTWRPQLDELAAEFTVIAWDGPGTGRSSDPPESFRMGDFADCLAGFIAALGLGRPHVAGLSFGSVLALELHRRHPGVAKSLVLASAYAGWAGSLAPDDVDRRVQQVLRLADLSPERFVGEVGPTMFSDSAPREMVDPFLASAAEFHPVGLRAMTRAVAEADLRDVLPRIDVPTLLLHGENDVRAPRSVADALHAAIPGSRLVVLAGAGHVCNIEAARRFNEEVRSFLL